MDYYDGDVRVDKVYAIGLCEKYNTFLRSKSKRIRANLRLPLRQNRQHRLRYLSIGSWRTIEIGSIQNPGESFPFLQTKNPTKKQRG